MPVTRAMVEARRAHADRLVNESDYIRDRLEVLLSRTPTTLEVAEQQAQLVHDLLIRRYHAERHAESALRAYHNARDEYLNLTQGD